MEELYQLIEEKIRNAGYNGAVDGEEIYSEICDEIEGKENGHYIFMVKKGDNVIVETAKGLEYAECVHGNHEVEDASLIPPLRPVVRIATAEDTQRAEENKKKETEAFEICREKIEKHELDMKLVDVEYNFDNHI